MPLFRRPEEEHDDQPIPDVDIKYDIRLTAYSNGSWEYKVYNKDSYSVLFAGTGTSRDDALKAAQAVAANHAKETQPIKHESVAFTVKLKGTVEQ